VSRSHQDIIKSILFGVAVGDALGVSAEFTGREELRANPVTGMAGYGKHGQPPGTWSDDSSLTFCLAEALTQGFDFKTIGQNFVRWRQEGFWTARGSVFDIGGTTARAITRLASGVKPETAGDDDENSNGNGSLMRILPLLLYIAEKPAGERFRITQQVSSLTHRHVRSVTACFIYLELARYLSIGMKKSDAYKSVRVVTAGHLASLNVPKDERRLFDRLLKGNIQDLSEDRIKSTGYVMDTLEAAVWCLMTTESYSEAVLKAVNLGEDADTTGAVTGGLAGLLYGYKSIPEEWIDMLARKDDIEDLAARVKRAGYKEIKN
jgi:ADP-ribosylglycohydrolase